MFKYTLVDPTVCLGHGCLDDRSYLKLSGVLLICGGCDFRGDPGIVLVISGGLALPFPAALSVLRARI
jgi:hypothetical protein